MRSFGLYSRCGAFVGGLAVAAGASTASATVLTFDMGSPDLAPNGVSMSLFQGYGDKVGGQVQPPGFSYGAGGGLTPNVQVIYGPGLHLGFSGPTDTFRTFGDLTNVIYRDKTTTGPNQNSILEFTLLADPGFQVCLFSFDMAVILGENLPVHSITIKNESNKVLFSQSNITIPGVAPTHTTFYFDGSDPILHPTVCGQELIVDIDLSTILSKIDRFAVDNIKFGQTPPIPTPGAFVALLTGTGLLATRRRRA